MAQYFELHPENPQPRLLKQAGRAGHRVGIAAHDLTGHRMVFAVDVDAPAQPFAAVAEDHVQ